jgi:uncharacterized membrane protein YccF (DUF307 family)
MSFYTPKRKEAIMKLTRNIGTVLLGIWLILFGMAGFITAWLRLAHPLLAGLGMILAILAIVAGIFILLDR